MWCGRTFWVAATLCGPLWLCDLEECLSMAWRVLLVRPVVPLRLLLLLLLFVGCEWWFGRFVYGRQSTGWNRCIGATNDLPPIRRGGWPKSKPVPDSDAATRALPKPQLCDRLSIQKCMSAAYDNFHLCVRVTTTNVSIDQIVSVFFFLNSNILYISDWNWTYWIRRVPGVANWQHQSDNWTAGVTINGQHVRNDTWLIQFIILSDVRQIDYANWSTFTKTNTTNHGNQNDLSESHNCPFKI